MSDQLTLPGIAPVASITVEISCKRCNKGNVKVSGFPAADFSMNVIKELLLLNDGSWTFIDGDPYHKDCLVELLGAMEGPRKPRPVKLTYDEVSFGNASPELIDPNNKDFCPPSVSSAGRGPKYLHGHPRHSCGGCGVNHDTCPECGTTHGNWHDPQCAWIPGK